MWAARHVTHALVHAATAERQRPYAVVGMDGRFLMSPLLLLPRRYVLWCGVGLDSGSALPRHLFMHSSTTTHICRRVFNVIYDLGVPFDRRLPAALQPDRLQEIRTGAQ